ncbi:UNVERIFIED_ORG: hypothetical protein BCL66_1131 [Martelella mediterranea]
MQSKSGHLAAESAAPVWSAPSLLLTDRTAAGPRCTCLNGVTWVVWKDFQSSEIFYTYGRDGEWNPPVSRGIRTVSAPTITAHNNQIYIAWRNFTDNFIFWSAYSGAGWSMPSPVPGARTFENPTLASYDGKLYMACNAGGYAGQTAELSYNWFDGESWSEPQQSGLSVYSGPAMATHDNALYIVVCPGRGQPIAWCRIVSGSVTGRWYADQDKVTDSGPALASDGDQLWFMWKERYRSSLASAAWAEDTGWGETGQVNGSETIFSPGLCGDFSGLRTVWKNYSNSSLCTNTLAVTGGRDNLVSGSTSPGNYVTVSLTKGEMSQSYSPVQADDDGRWSTCIFARLSDGNIIKATTSFEKDGRQSDEYVRVVGMSQSGPLLIDSVTPAGVSGYAPQPGQIIKGWRSSDGLLVVAYTMPSNSSKRFEAPYLFYGAYKYGDTINLVSQFPDNGTMTKFSGGPAPYSYP